MVGRTSRTLLATGIGFLAFMGACGGSETKSEDRVAHGSARTGVGPAAREVCSDMVRESVPSSVGLPLAGEPASSVRGDTFSCRYMFDGGALELSVRDLHTLRQAREYFRELRGRDGGLQDALPGLSEGGFSRSDGSVVAKKDAMILTVDVTQLPLGAERSDVAIDVAATVLGCW
jgi:hypothetical protein